MPSATAAKRRKTTRGCDYCRASKKRCTGTVPCDSCIRSHRSCTYLAPYTRGRPITPPPSSSNQQEQAATPVKPSSFATDYHQSTTDSDRLNRTSDRPAETTPKLRQVPVQGSSADVDATDDTTWKQQSQTPAQQFSAAPDNASEPASDGVLVDDNFAGPGSAHSWLKQAWSYLGRVRQHVFQLSSTSTRETSASTSNIGTDIPIFSYGDRVLKEDPIEDTQLPGLSASTLQLIFDVFFDRGLATYRFLHKPTVTTWLRTMQDDNNMTRLLAVRHALVLFMLALGSCYLTEAERSNLASADLDILDREVLFYRARKRLSEERGAPSVESAQARLLQVHYLLTSCRPNRAWYAFGTLVQLVFALGLHQKSYARQNVPGLARELRRRIFWSVYKSDKTLSIALGRPSLIREECITQEFPEIVNDEQVFADHIEKESEDDCLMEADIMQIKLARIIGRSMREYYENDDATLIRLIISNNERLALWKAELPPFLSGAVKPSSLIPVLRRQATILKVFHLHTVIFINRPLLLKSFSDSWSMQHDRQIQSSIDACIDAAVEIAKQAVQFNVQGQAFRAYWLSQNMTFNAVSILYLNSLRLLQGQATLSEAQRALVAIAEEAQKSLADASEQNAPAQRYGIVLEQLRLEVKAHMCGHVANTRRQHDNGTTVHQVHSSDEYGGDRTIESHHHHQDRSSGWTNVPAETSLNDASMFWPQLDGLPLGFDEWLGNDALLDVDTDTGFFP